MFTFLLFLWVQASPSSLLRVVSLVSPMIPVKGPLDKKFARLPHFYELVEVAVGVLRVVVEPQ